MFAAFVPETRPASGDMLADMTDVGHIPVLLDEVLDMLAPAAGQVCLDCTLGRGGHAAAIIPRLGPGGRYVGLDTDADNCAYASERLGPIAAAAGVALVTRAVNFAGVEGVVRELLGGSVERGGPAKPQAAGGGVDLLLADLGFASNQVDDPGRGLSFMQDAPLDMRLDRRQGATAAELVNTLPARELADLIYRYGEERLSRKIANKIEAARAGSPIQTTRQLAEVVRSAYGRAAGGQKIHPATRTFMALRIAVNGELAALDALLEALPRLLRVGGRAAIISFHSLEDRPVKRAFAALAATPRFELLTRKPVTPGDDELAANPRSRSAKLRGLRRLA